MCIDVPEEFLAITGCFVFLEMRVVLKMMALFSDEVCNRTFVSTHLFRYLFFGSLILVRRTSSRWRTMGLKWHFEATRLFQQIKRSRPRVLPRHVVFLNEHGVCTAETFSTLVSNIPCNYNERVSVASGSTFDRV